MNFLNLRLGKTYDTEDVRKLLEAASGHPCTIMDVANLSRPGKMLRSARVRKGVYNQKAVMDVMKAITIRRLATRLGRISQQYLDQSHAIECPQCKALAVNWDGKYLCIKDHTGSVTNLYEGQGLTG